MIYVITALLIISLIIEFGGKKRKATKQAKEQEVIRTNNKNQYEEKQSKYQHLTYPERLNSTKEYYPFKKWRDNFHEYEMEQYTEENCNEGKRIFDELINHLIEIGENGDENKKVSYFKKAVEALNRLNNTDRSIIETGEREDLCELIDQITIAAGLKPHDYANGDGLADLWRNW